MAVTCTTYQCNASMIDWSCPLSVNLTGNGNMAQQSSGTCHILSTENSVKFLK